MPNKIVNHFVLADGSVARYDYACLVNTPDIWEEETLNNYNADNVSLFSLIGNTHVYFITKPIRAGYTIDKIKVYTSGSGTLTLSLCKLDGTKAYLKKAYSISCVAGVNDVVLSEPFTADEDTFIGLSGNGVLMYRNDNTETGIYGTINNPLYETTEAISASGTNYTTSENYFCYPVYISVYKKGFVSPEDLEDRLSDIVPSVSLDNVNMLHYKKGSGNYTLWGRWFDLSVNGTTRKVTNNAGSEIMFFVSGANNIVFTFDQVTANTVNPFVAFSVDGGEFTRQQLTTDDALYKTTLTLPDSGEHLVRMSVDAISQTDHAYKWNGTGAFALVSITPDAGSMTAIAPMNKVGIFYGDSQTEGINVLGTGDTNNTQSATKSFSYWTARALNSVRYCIGYGGSGILQTGSFKPCIDAVNYYKNGVPTGDYYPDYIVINHGINDYKADVDTFIIAYQTVIDRLRIKYPGVPIFMVYPFFTSANNNKFVNGMETLANGYSNVYFINTLGWGVATTDGTHLSETGARSNGEKLATQIEKILGKSFFI